MLYHSLIFIYVLALCLFLSLRFIHFPIQTFNTSTRRSSYVTKQHQPTQIIPKRRKLQKKCKLILFSNTYIQLHFRALFHATRQLLVREQSVAIHIHLYFRALYSPTVLCSKPVCLVCQGQSTRRLFRANVVFFGLRIGWHNTMSSYEEKLILLDQYNGMKNINKQKHPSDKNYRVV